MTKLRSDSVLPRVVGRYGLLFYGLGNIIGAGVYVLIGAIAARAGYAAPVSFVIAAFAAVLTAFSYVELTGIFPVAASESVYAFKAFKQRWLSVMIGVFLFAAAIVSAATLVVSFSGYLGTFIDIPKSISMIFIVALMTALVLVGIKETVRVAVLFTLIEVTGLLIVIGSSALLSDNFLTNFTATITQIPSSIAGNLGLVFSGSFLAFYAFIGFEDMVGMAEEVKDPRKNYPFAIISAIGIATILYMLVALVSLSVLTPAELGASDAPLATVFSTATGWSALIISGIGLVAITNGLIAHFVTGARMLYGLSRQGWAHPSLRATNKRNVPYVGAILVSLLTLTCAFVLPLTSLAELTSLFLLSVFTVVNLSLVVLRRQKQVVGASLARRILPWLGAGVSATMLCVRVVTALSQ